MIKKIIVKTAPSAFHFIMPIIVAKQRHVTIAKLAIDTILTILFHFLNTSLSGKTHAVAKEVMPITNETKITSACQKIVQSISYTQGLGKKPNIQWITYINSTIHIIVTAFSTPSASSKFLVIP